MRYSRNGSSLVLVLAAVAWVIRRGVLRLAALSAPAGAGPFPDVACHVSRAARAIPAFGRIRAHRGRRADAGLGRVTLRRIERVAPRIPPLSLLVYLSTCFLVCFRSPARRFLPLRLARQAIAAACLVAEPAAVGHGVIPGDAHHRMVLPAGRRDLAHRRQLPAGLRRHGNSFVADKGQVLSVRDRILADTVVGQEKVCRGISHVGAPDPWAVPIRNGPAGT